MNKLEVCSNCGCRRPTPMMLIKGFQYFMEVDKNWFEAYRAETITKFTTGITSKHRDLVSKLESYMHGGEQYLSEKGNLGNRPRGFQKWLAGYVLIKDVEGGRLEIDRDSWDEYLREKSAQ